MSQEALPAETRENLPVDEEDSAGPALRAMAQARDIEQLERIRRAIGAVGEVAYHWDIASDRISWGGNIEEMLPNADTGVLTTGRGYATLLDVDNFTSRFETVMRSSSMDDGNGVPFTIEYLMRPAGRDKSDVLWIEDTGRWYAGPSGRPAEVYGILRRIDDRHTCDQHLRFLGNCDPLTGMMNRGRMAEALGEAISAARAEGSSCAFLIAAVNNLNVVNDAYGFDVADEVIISVGRRLRQVVRTGDAIGRYSGSKFGLILTNCSESEIAVAAERFMSIARESVIETERGPVWAMLSVGGLILPKYADTANAAMAKAEEALAEAKRRPTDGFVAFKPSPERMSVRGLNARCASEIVSSLREDRFTLAYQPIISAETGQPALHEALLRMNCPDGDSIAAVHLIPIAEKLGLVRLIDRRVMNMALGVLERNADVNLALNVSGITATDPRWFSQLTEKLSEHPSAAKRLTVEITETVALNDLEETTRFIDTLREFGCRVAIDDFGAGYTSFRNLKVLNVDMVKIDGSFCERLSENRDNQYFVRSLIDLAKKFNLETVAEWVEHPNDAELLRSWGIDYLQGNLFGKASLEAPWTGPMKQIQQGGEMAAGAGNSLASMLEAEAARVAGEGPEFGFQIEAGDDPELLAAAARMAPDEGIPFEPEVDDGDRADLNDVMAAARQSAVGEFGIFEAGQDDAGTAPASDVSEDGAAIAAETGEQARFDATVRDARADATADTASAAAEAARGEIPASDDSDGIAVAAKITAASDEIPADAVAATGDEAAFIAPSRDDDAFSAAFEAETGLAGADDGVGFVDPAGPDDAATAADDAALLAALESDDRVAPPQSVVPASVEAAGEPAGDDGRSAGQANAQAGTSNEDEPDIAGGALDLSRLQAALRDLSRLSASRAAGDNGPAEPRPAPATAVNMPDDIAKALSSILPPQGDSAG